MSKQSHRSNKKAHAPADTGRRRMLLGVLAGGGAVAVGGGIAWARSGGGDSGASAASLPAEVKLIVYDDSGQRVGERTLKTVSKSSAAWQKQLSPLAYRITREDGTERAYSGDYNKPAKPGFYRCIACDNALYDAATQFHSGTGWPSFWQPIAAENVREKTDSTFGMTRTAIACKRCDSHLGHVFNDGPPPTGRRYCMNAVALRFVATGSA